MDTTQLRSTVAADLDELFARLNAEADAQQAENFATITRWVEDASGGLLTAVPDRLIGRPAISIRRTDGQPLTPRPDMGYGEHVITGYLTSMDVSSSRKLTRRNRVTMAEVRDAVRTVLVRWTAEDDPAADAAYLSLWRFEAANRLA